MNDPLRTVDLFCGGGGLSEGLRKAGFRIVSAFDSWAAAVGFYNRNIKGHRAYEADLSDVDAAAEEIGKWEPSVIVGGPPCQDFSSAGKRDGTGRRANLTLAFASIVLKIRPGIFLMENVDRALKVPTYQTALSMFKDAGYSLTVSILDASLCGVPQKRKRAIAVGFLDGADAALVPFYKKAQSKKPMTMRDYFGSSLGIDCYYRHPRSYARRGVFSMDEPSPTVRGVNRPIPRGYPGHPGDARPVHSGGIRPLTTKERSLVQTFPAEWDLSGNKSDIEQIIGNAVPVELANFVGRAIVEYLKNKDLYPRPGKGLKPYTQDTFVFEQRRCYDV